MSEEMHEYPESCNVQVPITLEVPFLIKPGAMICPPQMYPNPGGGYGIPYCRYILCNHPGGSERPPNYGLRLDGLVSGKERDIYTFDFEYQDKKGKQAKVWLDHKSTGEIHIHGLVYGGQVNNHRYKEGTTDYWDIDFTYKAVGQKTNDAYVTEKHPEHGKHQIGVGQGTITSKSGKLGAYELVDFFGKPSKGYSFQFGDDTEHRGYEGISGWGWLNHSNSPKGIYQHMGVCDWIFTAKCPKLKCHQWKALCWNSHASALTFSQS